MTAKVEKGMQIFTGKNGGVEGGSTSGQPVDHGNVPTATYAPSPSPNALPKYANDPAYSAVGPVMIYTNAALSLVSGGADRGPDWDELQKVDTKNNNNNIAFLAAMLQSIQTTFKPSKDPPSQSLTTALTGAIEVGSITEICD